MPHATDLIESEHRVVEKLFVRFEIAPDFAIAEMICAELEQHTAMEEAILYPELQGVDEELYEDAVEEHQEVSEIIDRIRSAGAGRLDQVVELVSEMKKKVQHHVADEEQEDLPAMQKACGDETMRRLGEEMAEWRRSNGGGKGAGSRGGGAAKRSSGSGSSKNADSLEDLTVDELREKAREAGIDGRSNMRKDELIDALSNA